MKAEILVATPCYGDKITNTYFLSVLKSISVFINHPNINLHFFTMGSDSLITRARNVCTAMFLKDKRYTHLLFIDSDIGFEPENILRLIEKDEPLVCAPYPRKKFLFNKVKDIDQNKILFMSEDDIKAKLVEYNVHVSSKIGTYNREIHNGFMEVDRSATGFMLIKRDVFDRMMKAYPHMQYKSCDINEKSYEDYLWRFFDCSVDENNYYMSEDYAFCDLWRKLGGKIWLDVTARLTHTGIAHYNGDITQTMNIGRKH